MPLKDYKNNSPRVKIIQKIYGYLLNPDEVILYQKNQYKKYIKDVVSGTIERMELIEETISKHLGNDIDFKKLINFLKLFYFQLLLNLCLNIIFQKMLLLVNM